MNPSSLRVVVVGGGIAALETALALRELAGARTEVTLVAPNAELTYRPVSVGVPFSRSHVRHHPLVEVAADAGARFVLDRVVEVLDDTHVVRLEGGDELPYDALVLAPGAVRRVVEPYALTFVGPESADALGGLLADLEGGYVRRVAFVVPAGASWPLPLYELAIMTAQEVWSMGMDDVQVSLVSPEPTPLAVFGPTASRAVGELLDEAGIDFHGSAATTMHKGSLELSGSRDALAVDRIVTLPSLEGPRLTGVPVDADGFIEVDECGRVHGLSDVYAAGDAIAYAIKQGGIATQQADAIAVAIAADAGATVDVRPSRPVLRGKLMTSGSGLSLRRFLTEGTGDGESAEHALWWPPAKVAGRYLAPYLHGREEDELVGLVTTAPHIAVHHPLEAPPLMHALGQVSIELLGQDRSPSPVAKLDDHRR
jgi:sulfide:quinone oxidoreductase